MPSGLRDNNLKTRRHPVSPEWTLLGCGALGGVFASPADPKRPTDAHPAARAAPCHPAPPASTSPPSTAGQLLAIERAFTTSQAPSDACW